MGDQEGAAPVNNIYYGTCGWTDRMLTESGFYPAQANTAAEKLRYYAQQFPLVEVDATFYAPPSQRNAKLWAERTPSGFVFNVKAYAALTHHPVKVERLPQVVRTLLPASKVVNQHIYLKAIPPAGQEVLWDFHVMALGPLAEQGKLGSVLFQFPPWFHKNRRTVTYLEQLRDRLPYRIAVEFRGGGWMNEDRQKSTLEILSRHDLAYVVVDEPQGFQSSVPPVVACTAPLAVVRFHGHNDAAWEKRGISPAERFKYLYRERELKSWIEPIYQLARQADQVHALMNNCYSNYAVRNARQLANLLSKAQRTYRWVEE